MPSQWPCNSSNRSLLNCHSNFCDLHNDFVYPHKWPWMPFMMTLMLTMTFCDLHIDSVFSDNDSVWLSQWLSLCILTETSVPLQLFCVNSRKTICLHNDCVTLTMVQLDLHHDFCDLGSDICALMITVWSLQWLFLTLTMTLCACHCDLCATLQFHDTHMNFWSK